MGFEVEDGGYDDGGGLRFDECYNCGGELRVHSRSDDGAGCLIAVLGFLFAPCLIGIFLIIYGLNKAEKKEVWRECTQCGTRLTGRGGFPPPKSSMLPLVIVFAIFCWLFGACFFLPMLGAIMAPPRSQTGSEARGSSKAKPKEASFGKSIAELKKDLLGSNKTAARGAAERLRRRGKSALPALQALGLAASSEDQAVAIESLRTFNILITIDREKAKEERGLIEAATRSSNQTVAGYAASVLEHLDTGVWSLGTEDEFSVTDPGAASGELAGLERKLASGDAVAAERAARAISQLGERGLAAVEALGQAASDSREMVALAALDAFDRVTALNRGKAREKLDLIRAAGLSSSADVRSRAADLIQRVEGGSLPLPRLTFEGKTEMEIIAHFTKGSKEELLQKAQRFKWSGSDGARGLEVAGALCFVDDQTVGLAFKDAVFSVASVCPTERNGLVRRFKDLERDGIKQEKRQLATRLLQELGAR